MPGVFRMSVEIVFHMWRSAENTNAVSEMFSWALFFVMLVVSTHDCMTLWHSYPFFLKRWLIFVASTKIATIFTSHDGTPEIPHERLKASFFQTNCWDLWTVENPGDEWLWTFSTNLEGWKVFIWFFLGFRWLVHDWISKTSPNHLEPRKENHVRMVGYQ